MENIKQNQTEDLAKWHSTNQLDYNIQKCQGY